MKKGAIFDMDGVLFDTERLYQQYWTDVAAQLGQKPHADFPKAVCGTCGEHLRRVIATYYPAVDPQDYIDRCVENMAQRLAHDVPGKPGVQQLLTFLQENGVKMAVASSSRRRQIESNLKLGGIQSYFDAVVSGDDVVHGKPAPDIFLMAAEQLALDPADCYVIEDGPNGLRAGVAAGCQTIMIPDLTPPNDEIRAACAVFDSMDKLREALQNREI